MDALLLSLWPFAAAVIVTLEVAGVLERWGRAVRRWTRRTGAALRCPKLSTTVQIARRFAR